MPETAEKVYKEFNTTARDFDRLGEFGLLSNGTKVTDAPEILFKRLDAKEISEKVNAMYEARKPKETKKPENVVEISEIGIEDFMKVQLRVGEIVEAEKVKKANKLLKFSVKIGDETRTIVSGIAKYYTPEEMVGKQVVVVSNLKPAKLCGIESQGMLLCACTDDELTLVTPEKRMPTGATVR
jgi:methionyl-tRNA synthetase